MSLYALIRVKITQNWVNFTCLLCTNAKEKVGSVSPDFYLFFFFSSKNVILVLGFLKMLNKQETSTMAVNEQTYCTVIFVKTKVL